MEKQSPTQILDAHYQKWLNNPERMKSGYNYERTYVEMMRKVEKEILENSLGDVPENKNRKKKSKRVWVK